MKKSLFFLSFLSFILSQQAVAQQWKLTGNSDATSSSKLGTLKSQPLRFYTNNKERMQINSQGQVIVGGSSSTCSAIFEVSSTNLGVLIPRMTETQRKAIVTPAQGLLVYQKDGVRGFYYYEGGWKPVNSGLSNFANISLSNLGTTAINQDMLPNTDNTKNLGSSSAGWKDLYLDESVYLGGQRFLSAPGDNTFTGKGTGINNTGTGNTTYGYRSLYSNTTGGLNTAGGFNALHNNTTGNSNTAHGAQALYSNTTGHDNTAVGIGSLYNNTSGSDNTADGGGALFSNTTGNGNTAQGDETLYKNTTGDFNTTDGFNSLYNNTTGNNNTAHGAQALFSNTTGTDNTAQGNISLYYNTTGSFNTATGFQALNANTSGAGNTALGFSALLNNNDDYNTGVGYGAGYPASGYTAATFLGTFATTLDGLDNVTAVGSGAKATTNNSVVLGNTSVVSVFSTGTFVTTSDGRFKRDIKEEVPGLEFINKLRPVTYHYKIRDLNSYLKGNSDASQKRSNGSEASGLQNADAAKKQREEEGVKTKEKIVYTGFVAQEVEAAAKKVNYDFSGVHKPAGDKDVYGLSYAEFVVPLVKAVQELSKKADAVDELKREIAQLKAMIIANNVSNNHTRVPLSSAYLEQSTPNPSSGTAIIRYYVPNSISSAKIVFTDIKGSIIRTVLLSDRGKGQLTLSSGKMAAGIYTYTLYAEGKQTDSRQMVIR